MNKLKSLALAALATFGLSAYGGGTTTNAWWDITFETNGLSAAFQTEYHGGLPIGELGPLTNNPAGTHELPYTNGVWTALDEDESYVTNGLVTNFVNGVLTEVPNSIYLKLDTQSKDLTWTPSTAVADNLIALIDADLLLVGSDSEPDPKEFDEDGDVHTAIFLKNELYEDSHEYTGETSNSVLCVYVYDGSVTNETHRCWQELAGVELEDNSWAHVQVVVDYADAANPMVQVFVNGTKMHARDDATKDSWTAAVKSTKNASKLSSVAFRGTGAVDNFVGTTHVVSVDSYEFTANVYMDDALQAVGTDGNLTRRQEAAAGEGRSTTFSGFVFHDLQVEVDEHDQPVISLTYALSRIEVIDPKTGETNTFNYTYDMANYTIIPDVEDDSVVHFTLDGGDYAGPFTVTASTDGATGAATLVNIYFTLFNQPSPTKPSIDVGEGLSRYVPGAGETVPDPVAFEEVSSLFQVSFVPTVEGWYLMMTCSTPSGDDSDYVADIGSAVEVTAANGKLNKPVTLTETSASGTAKFVKIGWSATDPAQ